MAEKTVKTRVLVIGGGATGTGVARDLALRGIDCLLVERRDITAGASGANHGLLHSGARYVSSDPVSASECAREGRLLKKLAAHCIEDTGGLFVAVKGDGENYIADFPRLCAKCGVACRALDVAEILEMEPALSPDTIAVYAVEDAAVDPFRLCLENMAHALALGAGLQRHTEVRGFKIRNGRIAATRVRNHLTGEALTIEADLVINASGAWAGQIAAMAGAEIQVLYSKGSLLITDHRLAQRVINRLRPSSDADILVPGGTVSILGTTSIRIQTLDDIRPTIAESDFIVDTAAQMLPELQTTRYIRAYAGVRPLVGSQKGENDRSVTRNFSLFDHAEAGVDNFITITGGKLTTYRLMAEKAVDLACDKLGIAAPCRTAAQPLPPCEDFQWTEPGLAARQWVQDHEAGDLMLCECEMVPSSVISRVIESIRKQNENPDLRSIGLRSRIGKGSCQGAFCGVRISAYMSDRPDMQAYDAVSDLRHFLEGRWKGIRPVLWDASLAQEELQEALHCGLFGLEI